MDLEPIVKEIQSTILLVFDFEPEAWFMEMIKRNLEKHNFREIVCPIPYLDLCTKRLIVMQVSLSFYLKNNSYNIADSPHKSLTVVNVVSM